jgi:hypothetical protein
LNPNCDPNKLWTEAELQYEESGLIQRIRERQRPRITPVDTTLPIDRRDQHGQDFADLIAYATIPDDPEQSDDDPLRVQWQFLKYSAASKVERQHRTERGQIDVLAYWRAKSSEWPDLAAYAFYVNTRPITSAATERHFSNAVDIEGDDRLRLTPEHVEQLALLRSNIEIAEDLIMKS